MCGIAAIINKHDCIPGQELIREITRLVAHRGPDGEGYYHGENFAFGHRRLSIIDLSDQANQPMTYMEDFVIIFNGAIYNYIELRAQLQILGFNFKSDSDTEVILASYVHWGTDCVNHFNGMWAFSVFDKRKNLVFCSRDRFGVKPFYYYYDDEIFAFASEIKQLLPFIGERKVNEQILTDFLVTGILEHSNETFFKKIFKLPPSNNLIYNLDKHEFNIEKYYSIINKDEIKSYSFERSIENIKNSIERAVTLRLRSDARIGSCLSGGIDSSTIVALSALHYNSSTPLKVFHARSSEKIDDESRYAIDLAKKCNLDLEILEPCTIDFFKNLERIVEIQEEPFGGPAIFMQYFIFEKAKNAGIKVMLDGQGGDETLLGYEKYFPAYFKEVRRKSGFINFLKEILLANRNNAKMKWPDIFKFIIGTNSPQLRKMVYRKRTFFLKRNKNEFRFLDEFAETYNDLRSLQQLEIEKTMLPELLRYEDKNSMYNSIESRLPFLDYQFVENAISLKSEYKISSGWTKFILRRILSELLAGNIAWRKKKNTFNAPTDTWLSEIKPFMIGEISKSEIINKISNMDLLLRKFDSTNLIIRWRLFNIALWEKIYKVKI